MSLLAQMHTNLSRVRDMQAEGRFDLAGAFYEQVLSECASFWLKLRRLRDDYGELVAEVSFFTISKDAPIERRGPPLSKRG